jgi:excisionase family DNA binding protein
MSRQSKTSSLVTQDDITTAAPVRGLRVSDAATYAGVTHWHIRTAVWTGKLKAHRAGKVILIMRDDLDCYLNSLPEIQPSHAEWLAKRQQTAVQP